MIASAESVTTKSSLEGKQVIDLDAPANKTPGAPELG
jgi:hypothetical protein